MKQRNNKLNYTINHTITPKITSLSARELPAEIKNMNRHKRASDCPHNSPPPIKRNAWIS